jgi:hypothetical protein
VISELSRDNPALKALEADYRNLHYFEHSNWADFSDGIDIQNFRGEHAYMSQLNYDMTKERYWNTYNYLIDLGERDNIIQLGEDSAFGAITFTSPNGTVFSRDLLDSILEIGFIRETLGLTPASAIKILDIGAGYGRLLYRFAQMFPNSSGFGVDGVPLSTFLCDFYLKYRAVYPTMTSVPLTRLDDIGPVDLAVNAWSFAECTLSTVDFWIRFCSERDIRWLCVIPHDFSHRYAALQSREVDGQNINYEHLFGHYGYRLERRVSKYEPSEDSDKYVFGTEMLMYRRG